ncbi:MAG: hypothetical protein EOP53_16310, partial [Sphingobacteriales bacterium]
MQRLWQKLSTIGINSGQPYAQIRSSIFLNRICFVELCFVLTSLLINIIIGDDNFIFALGTGSLFLLFTYFLNHKHSYNLAKANIIIVTLALITFMLFKAGSGAGIEFYFLSLTMLPAIVFQDKRTIFFFQAICILALVGHKVYENIYLQQTINTLEIYRLFYIVNSIYCGLMIILALTFFKNQNVRSETELLEQKRIIEEKNETLQILNENLARSNRDLEQFAYVASHDLKEPLRMISSFATLLARKTGSKDNDISEYNKYITNGVTRMQNLIDDLLTYARIGSEEKAFTTLDTNYLIKDVTQHLALAIDETDAKISYNNLPGIKGIAPQLGQLFYNLISNSIKFRRLEAVPEITITCKTYNDFWQFAVKDNGMGIHENYKDKVFVIFQRLHAADKYPGTGIGLALCK